MSTIPVLLAMGLAAALVPCLALLRARVRLSRAKHPSMAGHPRIAQWLAGQLPFFEYRGDRFFRSDGAPSDVAGRRRSGFDRLACRLRTRAPETIRLGDALEPGLSD